MGGDVAVIEYIVLAILLAFIVTRLYAVLGRRTGHERQRMDPLATGRDAQSPDAAQDKVVPLPRHGDAAPTEIEHAPVRMAEADSPLARSLMDIQFADRTFEPESFLHGAKMAYEMIVTAFNAGDRHTLRPLLSADVFQDFDAVISDRESRDETMEFTFVGLSSAKITDANLSDRVADITVRFVTEVISVKKNSDGAVIEGDPSHVRQVTDVWTFSRDTSSSNPNWELVATGG